LNPWARKRATGLHGGVPGQASAGWRTKVPTEALSPMMELLFALWAAQGEIPPIPPPPARPEFEFRIPVEPPDPRVELSDPRAPFRDPREPVPDPRESEPSEPRRMLTEPRQPIPRDPSLPNPRPPFPSNPRR
jgi:hypothetical protein